VPHEFYYKLIFFFYVNISNKLEEKKENKKTLYLNKKNKFFIVKIG
jgi:hypothetical protein